MDHLRGDNSRWQQFLHTLRHGAVIYRYTDGGISRTVRTASWMPALILLALTYLVFTTTYRIWLVMFVGWLLVSLVSTSWVIYSTRNFAFHRHLLHSLSTVGDRLIEEFSLSSKGLLPVLAMEINDHSDLPDYAPSRVQSAGSFENYTWQEMTVSQKRGLFQLGPTDIRFTDLLGFFEIACRIDDIEEVLIHPSLQTDVSASVLPGGGQGSRLNHHQSTVEMAAVSNVRGYSPGDPVYRIHWPLSVRHQNFYVKEFDRDSGSDIWLVLDLYNPGHYGSGSASSIEYAVSWAGSLAWHYLEMGYGVGVAVYGKDQRVIMPPVNGQGQTWQVLRTLAPLEGQDDVPLTALIEELRPHMSRAHSMVIITPSVEPDWVNALARPSLKSVEKEVFLIDTTSFGAPKAEVQPALDGIQSLLQLLRVPVHVIRQKTQVKYFHHLTETLAKGQRTFRASKLRTVVVALIMVAFLLSVPQALAQSEWLQVNRVLWQATTIGAGIGYLLARRIRQWYWGTLLVVLAGLGFIVQVQGHVLPEFLPAVDELFGAARYGWIWLANTLSPVLAPAREAVTLPAVTFDAWLSAWDRLSLFAFNISNSWLLLFAPRNWPRGDVLLGTLLGTAVWLTSAFAGWSVSKQRRAWGLVVPVVGMLALNVLYADTGWGFFLFAAVTGIFLLGDTALAQVKQRWKETQLPYRLEGDWWKWSAVLTAVVGLAMGITYYVTDPSLGEWLEDALSSKSPEEVSDHSGAEGEEVQAETVVPAASSNPGVLPSKDLLSNGPELAEIPVMTVRTPGLGEASLYWRYRSYDEYTGRGWRGHAIGFSVRHDLLLWPFSVEPPPNNILVRQVIRFEEPTRNVFNASEPVRFSQPAEGRWMNGVQEDLVSVSALSPLFGYEVLSWVPTAAPDELRTAPEEYPGWVTRGYLKLPETLPERVVELAESITEGEQTVYDRAIALQNYLREYEYSLNLPPLPEDQDVVDYFLFDLKKGYCDYYATAMVVMARSIGIPSRLAVGYATGEYDPEEEKYTVTEANSHSWVEVYFPRHGWVRFEPTAAFEPDAPVNSEDVELYREGAKRVARAYRFSTNPIFGLTDIILPSLLIVFELLVVAFLVAVAFILVVPIVQTWWMKRIPADEALAMYYRLLVRWAKRLRVPVSIATTPSEFQVRLVREFEQLAQLAPRWWRSGWSSRLAYVRVAIIAVISTYRSNCYSPSPPPEEQVRVNVMTWHTLSRALWLFWLLSLRRSSVLVEAAAGTD